MSERLVDTVKKVMNVGLERHYCFSCAKPFDPYEAEPCEECGWLKCPHCGRCACDLSIEARIAIEQVFRTFCLACLPTRKYYPSLVADYEAGRISFDELKSRVERDIGLIWMF